MINDHSYDWRLSKRGDSTDLLHLAGYVGGPSIALVADRCPDIQVSVVDINQARIAVWNDADLGTISVYEPGLDFAGV